MKIAHLTANEKFTDLAARQFEEASPHSNYFYIFCDNEIDNRAHFAQEHCNAIAISSHISLEKLSRELADFDLIVFHSLYYKCARLALCLPKKQKLLWIFWGSEIYNDITQADKDSCGPITSRTWRYTPLQVFSRKAKRLSDTLLKPITRKKQQKLSLGELKEIVQRMNYIGSFIDEDIERIKQYITITAKPFRFSYSDIEQITTGSNDRTALGTNIFLGNSATYSNNHLETFSILSTLNLNGKKIICPLSYGDAQYKKIILHKGAELLGQSFSPLTSFMTLEEYNEILLGCPIAIMGHYRQQAVTNMVSLLWFGCKLYLSNKNPCFDYFKRIGLVLCSIEYDLTPANTLWDTPLSEGEITTNRNILIRELSHSNNVSQLKQELETIQL
ncbi:MAG: TDP-N-acetylfucosamine:lipid II N-acetylfucosaminyltransferase [Fibrobacterales bacterium]